LLASGALDNVTVRTQPTVIEIVDEARSRDRTSLPVV
jgi:hypothetical protein